MLGPYSDNIRLSAQGRGFVHGRNDDARRGGRRDAVTVFLICSTDLRHALAFALAFDGRRRFRHADELAARITAEHLARHLERCGFVVMRKPPGSGHSTSAGTPAGPR